MRLLHRPLFSTPGTPLTTAPPTHQAGDRVTTAPLTTLPWSPHHLGRAAQGGFGAEVPARRRERTPTLSAGGDRVRASPQCTGVLRLPGDGVRPVPPQPVSTGSNQPLLTSLHPAAHSPCLGFLGLPESFLGTPQTSADHTETDAAGDPLGTVKGKQRGALALRQPEGMNWARCPTHLPQRALDWTGPKAE